jgi:hypothetical protein
VLDYEDDLARGLIRSSSPGKGVFSFTQFMLCAYRRMPATLVGGRRKPHPSPVQRAVGGSNWFLWVVGRLISDVQLSPGLRVLIPSSTRNLYGRARFPVWASWTGYVGRVWTTPPVPG